MSDLVTVNMPVKLDAAAYKRQWYKENKDRHRANGKRWADANKDKTKAYQAKFYQENKEQILQRTKAYMLANSDKRRAWNRKSVMKNKYGFAHKERDEILLKQGNKCAICGTTEDVNNKRFWQIDHDHNCCNSKRTCGKCVRGILCSRCNTRLAAIEDKEFLKLATIYLNRFAESENS